MVAVFVVALPLLRVSHTHHGSQKLTSVNALFTTLLNIQDTVAAHGHLCFVMR